jgi:hypothetical protein
MNRIINCLNGFSELVRIEITTTEQIGNIVVIIEERLKLNKIYTIELHKTEVTKELLERGYDMETINMWLEYIV